MTAFNAEKYIADSIKSMLRQTYRNFDFLICDDASTDNTLAIIEKFAEKDSRIKVIKNRKNLNIGASATKLLKMVNTDLVARMDADDISFPERLEKQVDFLLNNPDVVMVGGQCITIDEKNEVIGNKVFPTDAEGVRRGLFEFMTVQQPATMMNLRLIPERERYYMRDISPVDDLEFLFRILNFGKVVNLPSYLIKYRVYENSNSLKDPKRSFRLTSAVRRLAVIAYNYEPTYKGIAVNLLQLLIVPRLPNTIIYFLLKSKQKVHYLSNWIKQSIDNFKKNKLGVKKNNIVNFEYKLTYNKLHVPN